MYGALSGVRVRDVGKGLTSWQRFQSSMTRLPRWLPRRRLRGALCELGGCASRDGQEERAQAKAQVEEQVCLQKKKGMNKD